MKLRKATAADLPLITRWMLADKYHCDFSPGIFFEEATETLVFEDENGPVLFVNLARALRAFVQFPPGEKERVREVLPEAFAFVKGEARKTLFRELIFESLSPRLIAFCKKRLGFRASPNEYKADI